jgi:hypothetical protein
MRGFLIPDIADNTFCVPYYLFYTKYIIDTDINRKEFPKPYRKRGMVYQRANINVNQSER